MQYPRKSLRALRPYVWETPKLGKKSCGYLFAV
jgi:hypothetical protein